MKFPPTPRQPRPELSIDHRHDLTCRWHRRLRAHQAEHRPPPRPDLSLAPAPPSASDGPSG